MLQLHPPKIDPQPALHHVERDFAALADAPGLGPLLSEAHPTVDHYLPALTIAGASDSNDDLTYMTDAIDLGSVSMRSFLFHPRQTAA